MPGTIDTLAGPSFCGSASVARPESVEVRGVAVDGAGRVFFETGDHEDAVLARVETDGMVTGVPIDLGTAPAPPAADARLPTRPGRLAADGSGGVVVAAGARVVDVHPAKGLVTVAGDPATTPGPTTSLSSGDGGPATTARFGSASAVATDQAGDVYIADRIQSAPGRFAIRFVNRSAEPVTFFPGTPHAVTVAPGHIDTIAGRRWGGAGAVPGEGVGGLPGHSAALAAAAGRLYVASTTGPARSARTEIVVINLEGDPLDAHGVQVQPGAVAAVPTGSPLSTVSGVAADGRGNLYVADEARHRVVRIDATGTAATFAGARGTSPSAGFNGNDRPAAGALLHGPSGVALGPEGQVFVADGKNGQIRVIAHDGTIRAVPGAGLGRSWDCAGDDQLPEPERRTLRRQFGAPTAVAADHRGNVFFTLTDRHQVKRIDRNGVVTTVAGRERRNNTCEGAGPGCAGFGGDGGNARAATLHSPTAVAVTARGDLYVLDAGNGRVRFVNMNSEAVTVHGIAVPPTGIVTVAGNGTDGSGGDGGRADDAQLSRLPALDWANPDTTLRLIPFGLGSLAASPGGDLLIADAAYIATDTLPRGNHRVRRVDSSGIITTVAGGAAPGPAAECCRDPVSVAADAAGNLYVADAGRPLTVNPNEYAPVTESKPRAWFVNLGTGPVTSRGKEVGPGEAVPVVGNGTYGIGGGGGRADDVQLLVPSAMVVDSRGTLYLAERAGGGKAFEGGRIRRVDASGSIQELAGNGQRGFNGDGLKSRLTSFNLPTGLALDGCGGLVIADLGNSRVRRLNLEPRCSAADAGPASSSRRSPSAPLVAVVIVGASVGTAATLALLARGRRRRDEVRPRRGNGVG